MKHFHRFFPGSPVKNSPTLVVIQSVVFAGHGLITGVVITDLLAFSPIPKLRRQFVFPILFAVTWFVFSYVYYASGGLGLKRHDPEGEGRPYLYKARKKL